MRSVYCSNIHLGQFLVTCIVSLVGEQFEFNPLEPFHTLLSLLSISGASLACSFASNGP